MTPYDEKAVGRDLVALTVRRGMTQKKMLDGLSFLSNDNMCRGVSRENLVVRIGSEQYERLLTKPSARPMDFTGSILKGNLEARR